MEVWIKYILPILSGLITAIPLVIKLVEYITKAVKEKNWCQLLALVTSYMEEAEVMFENGSDKKEWVMAMVANTAKTINYDVDMDVVSSLIDSLCAMSKVVNAPVAQDITEVEIEVGE